jgi:hypothetical protein
MLIALPREQSVPQKEQPRKKQCIFNFLARRRVATSLNLSWKGFIGVFTYYRPLVSRD